MRHFHLQYLSDGFLKNKLINQLKHQLFDMAGVTRPFRNKSKHFSEVALLRIDVMDEPCVNHNLSKNTKAQQRLVEEA